MTSTLPPSQIEVSLSFVDPSLGNVDPDAFEYVDMVPKSTKSLVFNRESSVPPSTKDPSSITDSFANKEERIEALSVKTESDPMLKKFAAWVKLFLVKSTSRYQTLGPFLSDKHMQQLSLTDSTAPSTIEIP